MFSFITMCLAAVLLLNECHGRFHRRNKLVRRQNAPMPISPNNMVQGPYPAQPPQTPVPSAYEMPTNPAMAPAYPPPPPPSAGNFLPPLPAPYAANPPVSSGSAYLPGAQGRGPYHGSNPNFVPNGLTNQSQTLATYNPLTQILNPNPVPLNKRAYIIRKNAPIYSYGTRKQKSPRMLHSHSNPFRERIQRRRKSVPGKKIKLKHGNKSQRNLKPASAKRKTKETTEKMGDMQKLLEEGEKILEISTESESVEETSPKSLDDFFEEDDEINGNVTVIPIPKGIQLKTNSAKGNKHVEETVNITSSTQKTLSIDNNTEIENVMEMEMEKKIEDDKGDSKGSEQVKIVETELVKPVVLKKGNSHKHRKRRFPLRKLLKQHRGKRSTTHSASFYSKMMKKFLHDLRRSDRAIRMTGELNRIETTTPRQSDERITRVAQRTDISRGEKKSLFHDKSVYDSGEMEEFLKQFLAELIKLRKTRERNEHLQYFNISDKDDDLYFTRHRKKHNYSKHKKSVMNLNVTIRDDKLQYFKPDRSEYIPSKSESTNNASSTTQRAFTILYLNDKKDTDSRLLVVLIILSVMTFLLPLLLCILAQFYKTSKSKEGCSAIKQYPFYYPELENNKSKEGICTFRTETFAADEHLQLEWQSDNGDWLSEKEIEFK